MSKLPHWLLPGFWGLQGKTLERAKIEYYYSGRIKEEKLIDVTIQNPQEREIQKLELKKKYKEISDLEFEKQKASLLNEPWVHGDLRGDPKKGFYFDLDWNDEFIKYLRAAGFTGFTDEETVDMWLTSLYTNEMLAGGFQHLNQTDDKVIINHNRRDDGKTEYK